MLGRIFSAAVLVAAIFAVLVVSGTVHFDSSSLSISAGSRPSVSAKGGKRTANATRSVALGAVPAPITEASGLAASSDNAGVVWTHNDSGGAASLYALGRRAQLKATLEAQLSPLARSLAALTAKVDESVAQLGFVAASAEVQAALNASVEEVRGRLDGVQAQLSKFSDAPTDGKALAKLIKGGFADIVTRLDLVKDDIVAL